jgi:N-acetylated-alpha-linked acidic dipeptidase
MGVDLYWSRRRLLVFGLLSVVILASLVSAETVTYPSITGFSDSETVAEFAREKQFDASLDREEMKSWLARLSSRPHHLGSLADKENAEWIAAQFRAWGYDTKIETFIPFFPRRSCVASKWSSRLNS